MIVTPNDIFLYNNGTECFDKFKRNNLVKLNPRNVLILVFCGVCESKYCDFNEAHCFYQSVLNEKNCGTAILKVNGDRENCFRYLKITEDDVMRLYGETIYKRIKKFMWLSKYRSDNTDGTQFHCCPSDNFIGHMLSKNATREDEFDKLAQEALDYFRCYQIPQEYLHTEIDDWMIHTPCQVVENK